MKRSGAILPPLGAAALLLVMTASTASAGVTDRGAALGFVALSMGTVPADSAFALSARAAVGTLIPLDAVPPLTEPRVDGSECAAGQHGIVTVSYSVNNLATDTGSIRRTGHVSVGVSGCYGEFGSEPSGTGRAVTTTAAEAAFGAADRRSLLTSALSAATRALRDSLTANASFVRNLVGSGVPLSDGDRNAFVALRQDETGVHVARLDPRGAAAQAGLAIGDVVTAIDGISISSRNLVMLITHEEIVGHWSVTVGNRTFSFEAPTGAAYVKMLATGSRNS